MGRVWAEPGPLWAGPADRDSVGGAWGLWADLGCVERGLEPCGHRVTYPAERVGLVQGPSG